MVRSTVHGLAVLMIGSVCWMAGCTQVRVPDQIGQSLRTLRGEMQAGRANVQQATASVKNLRETKGAYVKPAYDDYLRNLTALEEKAGGVRLVGDIADDKAVGFFQQWEKQLNDIQNANVSQSGQERRQEVMAAYGKVKATLLELRTAYRPYYASLQDIKKSLDADLTEQGVKGTRPAMDSAITLEPAVLEKIDQAIRTIDDIVHP